MDTEKRKYARFSPQGNAFAALGRRYTKVGRIKDINLKGLAFEYIPVAGTDRNSSRIDIFLVGDVFQLNNIPCEVLYDNPRPVLCQNLELRKLSPVKRCGVKFGILSDDDLAQLKIFLESHSKELSS